MTGDVNDVMPGSGAEDFEIWKKKQLVVIQGLEEGSQFLSSPWRDQLVSEKCAARLLSQLVASWRSTNSQHRKKSCLFLLMSKNLKLQKLIKISYLNQFRVFWIPICVRTCYVYFTYSYLGHNFWSWICNITPRSMENQGIRRHTVPTQKCRI